MAETRKTIEPLPARRRTLHFENLSEVLDDVRKMHALTHRSAGNWTLAQVCKHLANTVHGSIDGLLLGSHRLRRLLLCRRILTWTLKHGIPPGVTLDPKLSVSRKVAGTSDPRLPPPGTYLEREYKGRRVIAKVLVDGFEFDGQIYRSLSAIAHEATGTKWNGFLFFNLTATEEKLNGKK